MREPADLAVWEAYRTTVFAAMVDGQRLEIRVEQMNPALDELLIRRSVTNWAFITAWNPRSEQLPRAENDARHEQLKNDVRLLGLLAFEGQGEPAGLDWPPEESLLVLDVPVQNAVSLGRQYGQTAIVVGEMGREAKLLSCSTDT